MSRATLLEHLASPALIVLIAGAVGCSPAPSANADAGTDVPIIDAPLHDADSSVDVAVDAAVVVDAPVDAVITVDAPSAADAPIDAPVPLDAPAPPDAPPDVPADAPDAPTGCRSDADCDASTEFCRADMRCVPRECVPASARCTAGGAREVCDARGTTYAAMPCAPSESCRDGACVPHVCVPGATTCAGATAVRRCNDDGLGYTSTTCAARSACVDATGVCTPWACTPLTATGCRERALLVCAANGQDTVAVPCPPTTSATVTCTAGACVYACNAGYGDCDGLAINGCETELRTSATHCGRCGNACAAGVACRAYACGGPTGADFALAYSHGCARHSTGTVSCWGNNFAGQLGDGSEMASLTPVPAQGLSDATQMSATYAHTCAVRSGGSVVCWGLNSFGGLGAGTFGGRSTVPVTVLGLGDAVEVAAGSEFACALRESGSVYCWGVNTHGQLGNNAMENTSAPVPVAGLGDVAEIAAGHRHACARRSSGAVVCWGDNSFGQLGDGSTTNARVPVTVLGPTNAVEVSVGANHSCARRASGTVVCWGQNDSGQLGRGSAGASASTPATVVDLSDATQISAGAVHTCARRASGTVVCWGSNGGGALGNGTTVNSPRPVTVAGLTDVVRVVAGYAGSGARRAGGEVVRWGANEDGRLGGRMNPILVPTAIPGFP